MRYYFIVAAAGVGKRMNLDMPKQFLEHNGDPIYIKTLKKINENPIVTDIIVVTNREYVENVTKTCYNHKITKNIKVIAGGKERQDSVYNALLEIDDVNSIVSVQDGVRPFIKDSYIKKSFDILNNDKNIDGVVIGVPVKDTVKIVDENGFIKTTPVRSTLYAAHTPQTFRSKDLLEAYQLAKEKGLSVTDDSSLMEQLDKKIKLEIGDYDNVKLTTPEDLIHLER